MWRNRIIISAVTLITVMCPVCGQTLFTEGEREALGKTLSNYIESTVDTLSKMQDLEALLLSSKKNFYIFINGKEPTSLRTAAKQMHSLKENKYKLYMSKGDKLISCRWELDGGKEIKVQAEVSREAVEGTDKEQADKQISALLQSLPESSFTLPIPQEKDLHHLASTSLLVHEGKSYLMKDVNESTYYTKENGQIVAANNKDFPVETIHNIMLNALQQNAYKLNIETKIYNTVSQPTIVSLKDLISYWQQEKALNIYCGVSQTNGEEDYNVIIIAENKELQYIHLMKLVFKESMFDVPDSVIKASLTPNIPQHNLKSLFNIN